MLHSSNHSPQRNRKDALTSVAIAAWADHQKRVENCVSTLSRSSSSSDLTVSAQQDRMALGLDAAAAGGEAPGGGRSRGGRRLCAFPGEQAATGGIELLTLSLVATLLDSILTN